MQVWWLGWRLCCASWRYQHTTMLGLSFFLPFMVSISCCQAPAEYHLYQAISVIIMKPHLYNSVRMILHWPNGLTTNVHHMCYFWSKLMEQIEWKFQKLICLTCSTTSIWDPASLQIFHIMMQCTKPALERSNIISFTYVVQKLLVFFIRISE